MGRIVKDLLGQYAMENGRLNNETIRLILETKDVKSLMNKTISCLPLYYDSKQRFLEAATVEEEYELLVEFLQDESEISRIKKELQEQVKQKI
jgi:ATP-dependent Lon protease